MYSRFPFEEIAAIVERTPEAARQLASRARRKVQGSELAVSAGRAEQRAAVDALLVALRRGDIEGIVSVLDPDVLVKIDGAAGRPGATREIRGARNWAKGAVAFSKAARFAEVALVDGAVGAVFAPEGRLSSVVRFAITNGKIVQVHIISDPAHLRDVDLAVLPPN
jgi:RNA polymerase sigma-70 factor (ECF subfamily)